jgi:hypothetical protein
MKEMEINKTSWHFKLASKFGGLNTRRHDDFCSYTRRVLLAFLALFGIGLGIAFAAYLVSSGLFFLYLRFTLGHWPKEGWYAVGCFFDAILLVVAFLFGLIALIAYLFEQRKIRHERLAEEQYSADQAYYEEHGVYPVRAVQTHILRDMYRAFKEKTCYRIKLS